MKYYAGWLFLVLLSLAVSIVGFLWALRDGQFADQERARYLPLGKDLLSEPILMASRATSRVHTVSMCVIAVIGCTAFAAALILSLYHH